MFRTLALVVAVMALVCFVSAPVLAQEEKGDVAEGTFVKADGKTLTVKGKDDKDHSCEMAPDAKVSLDGKAAQITDLKPGFKVRVTLVDKKATKIDALSK
jgi:hypothetical protein